MLAPSTPVNLVVAAAAAISIAFILPSPLPAAVRAAPAAFVRPSLQINPLLGLASPAPGLPPYYQPDATHQFADAPALGMADPTDPAALNGLADIGMSKLAAESGMADSDVLMISSFVDQASNLSFVHATQMVDGLPVVNAVATVATDLQGNMLAIDEVPYAGRDAAPVEVAVANIGALLGQPTGILSVTTDAATGTTTVMGATWAAAPIVVKDVQYITKAGDMVPSYFLNVAAMGTVYYCYASAASAEILGCSDLSSSAFHNLDGGKFEAYLREEALAETRNAGESVHPLEKRQAAVMYQDTPPATVSYKVVPFNFFSVEQIGGSTSVVTNPSDSTASPNGWHSQPAPNGGTQYLNAPFGNNVFAANNSMNISNPLTIPLNFPSPPFQFLYTADLTKAPNATAENSQAGVTNMFYTANIMHDLFFHYGFTEAAGNFQLVNYRGQGGVGGDPVVATAQDGAGFDNARFLTQPDGVPGRMRMFMFTATTPFRDGAMDNGVVAHESTHGLSNRLTGGPANANCLQTIEAGGMGEGWSDMVSLLVTFRATDTRDTDRPVGAYVVGDPRGVRTAPYSTSVTRNLWFYSDVGRAVNQEVHLIGEAWCTMLFEVYWNMVDLAGFTPVTNLIGAAAAVGTAGNSDFFLIMVRGMMLQPCNPTFIQARDAFVAADRWLTGGKYQCAIWNGFAKRGLGLYAVAFFNNYNIPPECIVNTTASAV